MQTTLLGLAIAIILALVSALVAPLVVDWSRYRTGFEEEASRLLGVPVRVNGSIEARILPTPHLKLRDVTVGATDGAPSARVDAVELEVGLGPLLRGKIQATVLRLVAPQVHLVLDRSGAIGWPDHSPSFRPDALTISRLSIMDGRIFATDARSHSRLVLEKLSFDGDLRSLVGPFRGGGAFVAGGEAYAYQIASNRFDKNGGLQLKFQVDATNQPLTAEIEGTLGFTRGVPQLAGTLTLARPVGVILADGKRVMSDPWQLAGKLNVTPASASLKEFAFQYGPDERAVRFKGQAKLTLGKHPHLEGSVSTVAADIDRALAAPDVTHRPPFVMIRAFFEVLAAEVKPPLPILVGIAADSVTVGGTTVHSLRGNVRFDERQWSFEDFSFRAPGFTEVNISGHLENGPQGLVFNGPAKLESLDINALMAWLEGGSGQTPGSGAALKAHADITVATDRFALERLSAALGKENVEGRLAYTWATARHPAAMDGELNAATLNIDALADFARASSLSDRALALPHRVALVLDVGKLTVAGIEARAVNARIKFDRGILDIDRLSVGDLGGAALDINGRIEELSSQPRGQLRLDLDAGTLAGLTGVVSKLAPSVADALRPFADRLSPARVQGTLTVDKAAPTGTTARLVVSGQAGATRLAFDGEVTGEPNRLSAAVVRIKSRVDADDGNAIARLLHLDRIVAVDQLPGQLTISASGPLDGAIHVNGLATAGGFSAVVEGMLRLQDGPTGSLTVKASAANLGLLRQFMTGQPSDDVPISASATVAIAGTTLTSTDFKMAAGNSAAHGRLAVKLDRPPWIEGDIKVDDANATALAAMLFGLPRAAHGADAIWSQEPFGPGAFAALNGSLKFTFDQAAFLPALVAHDLTGTVRFEPSAIIVSDIQGALAGGRLAGELTVRHDSPEFTASGRFELADADAAILVASNNNAVEGRLTLTLEGEASGQTPAIVIGSLHGNGTIALRNARFSGVDTAAFDAAIRAADQNGAIAAPKIRAAVYAAMAQGRFTAAKSDAELTIAAGQVHLTDAKLHAPDGGELSLESVLDFNTAAIDAQITLSAQPAPNALIPSRPELDIAINGPLEAPKSKLDVSPLVAWLTLRAAELQIRRLESVEANRREDALGPIVRPQSPVIRFVPLGTAVETAYRSPSFGAPAFDRLRSESPLAPPATRLDRGPAAATAAPSAAGTRPVAPRIAPGTEKASSAAATVSAPPPPVWRSPLDLLFGSQN